MRHPIPDRRSSSSISESADLDPANALISAAAAAAATAAYLAGLPALSASAIAVGLIGDMMVAHGLPLPVVELVIGAGLISLGALGRAKERHQS